MDSILNVVNDDEENETLHTKYQELVSLSPKTKTKSEVNSQKNLKPSIVIQFPLIQSPVSLNEGTKSTIHTYSFNSQQFTKEVQSLNTLYTPTKLNQIANMRQVSTGECSIRSLSPKKSDYEIHSDYTFKLQNGMKKVRFRLSSDNQK